MSDLEEAIQVARQAINATPEDHPDRPGLLDNLGCYLGDRYERTGAISDLNEAIQVARQAINATPEDHPDRPGLLDNLGCYLGDRYERTGAISDLNEAIQVARQAINATPENHPDRPGLLDNLGCYLGDRYERTGAISDLNEAIQVARQAINATPENHPDRPGLLDNLGCYLGDRYERTGAISDLNEAIQVARQAINATPENHPNRPGLLDNLGCYLGDRYERTGAISDLNEAIQVARQAINATPENHPNRPGLLDNLRCYLGDRYKRTGAISDLNEAIQVARQAINATPENHPNRPGLLDNLRCYLGDRYERTGAISDLNEAIQVTQQAINITLEDHPNYPGLLDNLGCYLGDRYERMGAISDLNKAIQVTRQAVNATPEDHPDRLGSLDNLGSHLSKRYSRTGAISDLDEAIQVTRQAVNATPEDHPDRLGSLGNLGSHLSKRYSRTGAISDLDEAIQVAQQAVNATPEDHPNHARRSSNLACHLGDRYLRTEAISDLNKAIQIAQQAVNATPEDHPDRPGLLDNLGSHLSNRYLRTGATSDLNEAIQITQQAVNVTPEDHPDRARRSNNLAGHLGNRYSRTKVISDLAEVAACYESALVSSRAPINVRISAGIKLIRLCALSLAWEQAFRYSRLAIILAHELPARPLENSDKEHRLGQIAGLARDASAAALNAGKAPLVALNLLEEGRGVLAASLSEMRTNILDLRAKHPELAKRFIDLRNELHSPLTGQASSPSESGMQFFTAQADRRHFADSQLDVLIAEIRQQPGFEYFLDSPYEGNISDAGERGPIVVINISRYRSDAILVEQDQIRSVPLLNFTYQEAKDKVRQKDLSSHSVLQWLWDVVTLPILDALGFTEPPLDEKWPHVWWIPTGLSSKFPLHAAGYHGKGSNCTVVDRVMSSYSSSINAIIHGRRRRGIRDTLKVPDQALLVALQDTPNQTRLHFAAREVNMLHDLCSSSMLHSVQPGKRKKDVVAQLPSCQIFHFAGHGHTDNKNPIQSSLLLEDWESDPLTVSNLLEMNLHEHAPFLAYLSACGTGEVKNQKFLDESIHLVSAYQLAGFRHVIGTLWEVNDESCVDMAKITYEEIIRGGMTDESVCLGLHKATRKLRDHWLRYSKKVRHREKLVREANSDNPKDEKAGIRDERDSRLPRKVTLDDSDEEDGPLHWVPYVHYGV